MLHISAEFNSIFKFTTISLLTDRHGHHWHERLHWLVLTDWHGHHWHERLHWLVLTDWHGHHWHERLHWLGLDLNLWCLYMTTSVDNIGTKFEKTIMAICWWITTQFLPQLCDSWWPWPLKMTWPVTLAREPVYQFWTFPTFHCQVMVRNVHAHRWTCYSMYRKSNVAGCRKV